MRYLFDDWDEVAQKLAGAEHLLLLLDYDGTLTPIVRKPHQAHLNGEARKWLKRLARLRRVTVGVISGRSIADVSNLVSLRNIYYAGNHGLEILAGRRKFVHPVALQARPTLRRLAVRLKRSLKRYPGATLDDKGLTVTVHYRRVKSGRSKLVKARIMDIVGPFLASSTLRVMRGKKVLEVRPNIGWNKGHAIGWLVKRFGKKRPFPVYVGDDTTDEDAFRHLRTTGLTVRVGRKVSSSARYYVNSTAQVQGLLKSIYEICSTSKR